MSAPFTLRFVEWECGHHGQRPEDIPVQTPAQGELILTAISYAISQPGHARAVLFDEARGVEFYVTDDYASATTQFANPERWPSRPLIIHGTAEEIDEATGPALHGARESLLCHHPERWDGKSRLHTYEEVFFVGTAQAVETTERAGLDEFPSVNYFELPPIFRAAPDLLAELRAEAELIRLEQAEGGAP